MHQESFSKYLGVRFSFVLCILLVVISLTTVNCLQKGRWSKNRRRDDDDDFTEDEEMDEGISTKNSSRYEVAKEIFAGYKTFLRPTVPASAPTVVNLTVHLVSIYQVDEKTQNLMQDMFLTLSWVDDHLGWDASQFVDRSGHQLDHLVLPQERVWRPDIVVTPLTGRLEELGYDEMPLRLESSGLVLWQPGGVFTTKCTVDITFFPFDQQHCHVWIMAWGSRKEELVLQLDDQPVDDTFFTKNAEWQVLTVKAFQEDVMGTFSIYSGIGVTYTMKRRPMFPVLTIVVPTVLLTLMSTLVFALPAQSGEKMSLCVTVFLALVLSLSILLTQLPNSSLHLSVYVSYLVLLSSFSALNILLSLLVLRLHHRGGEGNRDDNGQGHKDHGDNGQGFGDRGESHGPGHGDNGDGRGDDGQGLGEGHGDSPSNTTRRFQDSNDVSTVKMSRPLGHNHAANNKSRRLHVDGFWVRFVHRVRRYRRMNCCRMLNKCFAKRSENAGDYNQKKMLQHAENAMITGRAEGSIYESDDTEVTPEEPDVTSEEVTWEEVAASLDYVFFRVSLGVVCLGTCLSLTIGGLIFYSDGNIEWGRDK